MEFVLLWSRCVIFSWKISEVAGSVDRNAIGRRETGHVQKNDSCRAYGKVGDTGTDRCR
jgi:hypothetical protein